MKKNEKDNYKFWHRKLTLKVKFWHFFDTSPLNQFSKFNNFLWAKIFPILYPPLENSTTRITIRKIRSCAKKNFLALVKLANKMHLDSILGNDWLQQHILSAKKREINILSMAFLWAAAAVSLTKYQENQKYMTFLGLVSRSI